MANLFQQNSSANAYKAHAKTLDLIEEISNFSNPTQHTRTMVFLRALIFSSDTTTQRTTASVIKAYMATPNTDLKGLQEHVIRHGSPPYEKNIDGMVTIANSPGCGRLCAIKTSKYYEHGLENMFQMVIECNARISIQGLDTAEQNWSTKRRRLGQILPKQKQTKNEHGHSCAVFIETTNRPPTTTGFAKQDRVPPGAV